MKKIFLALLLIIFILAFFLPPKLIKISSVECSSQYGDCPEEINEKLQNLRSKSLIEVKKETSKILKDNFLISDFSTQFRIPGALKVNLVIRKAIFALKQKDTSNYSLIDKDGYVVAIADASALPTVIVNEKLKNVGEKIDEGNMFSLKIMSGVFNMYQLNSGEIKEDSLVVELPTPLNVIFPLEGEETRDTNYYLGVLRLIVTKIENESSGKYREIDLRFKNPVLR